MKNKKERSLRSIVLVLTGISFILCEIIIIGVFCGNMLGMLKSAEKEHLDELSKSVRGSLESVLINLHSNTRTWSSWDETYDYIEGSNPQFIDNNLGDGTMLTMYKVDYVVIKDKHGNDLYTGVSDLIMAENSDASVPEGLSDHITPISLDVMAHQDEEREKFTEHGAYSDTGFVVNGDDAYMICVMPVMHSNEVGGSNGTFTFIVTYGNNEIINLTNLDTSSFSVIEQNPDDIVYTNTFEIKSNNNVTFNTVVNNLGSDRSVILQFNHSRLIYSEGLYLILLTTALLTVALMGLFSLLFVLTDRILLKSFRTLVHDLENAGTSGRINTDKYATLNEIHTLGVAVNDLIDRIDESSRAEEESKASLNILKNIMNSMDAYLYVSDPATDEILFINDKMKEHYGMTGDGVGEICWKALQSGYTARCSFCPCNTLKTLDDSVVWEEHNEAKGTYYQNTDRLIRWVDDRMVHLQHSVEISDIKNAEIELKHAKELAEQGSRAKGEFLSRMSHEMRTPMNAIIGMTNIAKGTSDMEKKENCLDKIDNASRHLLGVINDILDMSKIEADKFELSCSEFNLANMVTNVINVVKFRMDDKSQVLNVYIDPEIPQLVFGDEQRFAQVITNLLTNAAKFTPDEGHIDLDIRMIELSERAEMNEMAERDKITLQVIVTDTGIGISKEQQQKLFTSFEQADGSITRKFGGTGLGLAISKRIVELMGGTIWIESESGKGSKFIFTANVTGMSEPEEVISEEFSDTESGSESEYKFADKVILIAEDIEINREIVITILEDTEVTIDCAENGSEAVKMFRDNPSRYDLIFMDMHMPEMDGLEATRQIRALNIPEAKTIPIVAMTANVFKEDIDRCIQSGMDDHIGKPINFSDLLMKLNKYFNK